MEKLKSELSVVVGETLSKMEKISEHQYAHLYSLHNDKGFTLPILAKVYASAGIARKEAYKLSVLARHGNIHVPTVYDVVVLENSPFRELLLVERVQGITVNVPTRTPERWPILRDQIIESLLAWHRVDSAGYVGAIDNTAENTWPAWYGKRINELWEDINKAVSTPFDLEDKKILFRSKTCLELLFEGFNDNSVLVHSNLLLRNMYKNHQCDQLLSIVNPGSMLWAPREYDLFRWHEDGMTNQLLSSYLERAPVAEGFMARRWLYLLWDGVFNYFRVGKINMPLFKKASTNLLPWLK